MILNKSQPDKSLYVLGAKIITFLKSYDDAFQVTELFEVMKKQLEISFSRFVLAIDWLFIIDVIEPTNDGRLKKCF